YTKEDGKVPVVYFWDGSKSTEMKVLSSTDTSVTFETDHNSEYIVASEMLSNNGNSNEQLIPIIAVLIVVLIAIGGFFIIRRRRNA
ncbi:LPXTG cell wall anchor domain-containing protein, partial [Methanomethylophilus alvi]|uniref:LPXTG cell wall anchor domain-containing protein n=1 Tax=Methanomethylophilus alvi TaxID=1291540 RepID=UPI0037DC3C5A